MTPNMPLLRFMKHCKVAQKDFGPISLFLFPFILLYMAWRQRGQGIGVA